MNPIIVKIIRLLLGLIMVIIGLNKFLVYIEIPNPPGDGGQLMQVYINSGFLKIIGVLEMLGGIALLSNRFVPLGLTFITAIMFNASLFHLLHDRPGLGPAAFCLLLSILLVFAHKERFSELLSA